MADKLTRFNLVVPWFKAGKIYWPEEMKTSRIIGIAHGQIKLVTNSGIKGKDDFIDTISMLGFLTPWRPSDAVPVTKDQIEVWEEVHELGETSGLASYIV
jgi:hypothetical protein